MLVIFAYLNMTAHDKQYGIIIELRPHNNNISLQFIFMKKVFFIFFI